MTPLAPLDSISISVSAALKEDIGSGDITAELILGDSTSTATILCREPATICGVPWASEVFKQLDPDIQVQWHVSDGQTVAANQTLATLTGCSRHLLTAERTALNFLQTLSATATISRQFAQLVAHTQCRLLDTRKTLPGLRLAQKYAVACGGCQNHRIGLYDAFLIKENHILACGSISCAVSRAKKLYPLMTVEVEVETLEQLQEALDSSADIIMLDNFSLQDMEKAVQQNNKQAKLEASGMVDQRRLVEIAETGVDYISIGALTKNCQAIDLSMLFTHD